MGNIYCTTHTLHNVCQKCNTKIKKSDTYYQYDCSQHYLKEYVSENMTRTLNMNSGQSYSFDFITCVKCTYSRFTDFHDFLDYCQRQYKIHTRKKLHDYQLYNYEIFTQKHNEMLVRTRDGMKRYQDRFNNDQSCITCYNCKKNISCDDKKSELIHIKCKICDECLVKIYCHVKGCDQKKSNTCNSCKYNYCSRHWLDHVFYVLNVNEYDHGMKRITEKKIIQKCVGSDYRIDPQIIKNFCQ